MTLLPDLQQFERLASEGFNLIPVSREIAADLETPVSAFLKVARGDYSFLLESVRGGEKWGRYTFLGTEPSMVMRARGDRTDIIRPGRGTESRIAPNAFEELRKEVKRFKAPEIPGLPRFFGGAVGFLAYDIVRCFEPRIPARAHDDLGTPDLYMMFTDSVLMFDNVRQSLTVIVNVAVNDFASPREGYEHAQQEDRRDDRSPRRAGHSAAARRRPGLFQCAGRRHLEHQSRGLHDDGVARQGVHHRRRYHPGGAVAALRGAARSASVQHLSQPAHHQSVALHVLPAPWRSHDRRRLARGDGAGRGPRDHPAPDRGNAPRAARPSTRIANSRRNSSPIRRSAPSTSCWSTSGATMSAASLKSARSTSPS